MFKIQTDNDVADLPVNCDDVLQSTMPRIPIFSKNIKDVLNKGEIEGIQYIPVDIINGDININNEYYIAITQIEVVLSQTSASSPLGV